MRHSLPLLSLAGLAALSACNQSSTETVNETYGDPMAEQLRNAPVAELPPPLKESKTFRCKDNSLVYIDFFQGDTQVNIRTDKEKPPVRLKAAEAGKPFEAEGYVVDGSGGTVTVTVPGKAAQSCKA